MVQMGDSKKPTPKLYLKYNDGEGFFALFRYYSKTRRRGIMRIRVIGKRISAMFLSAVMAIATVTVAAPAGIGTQTVSAAEKPKTVAGLSTSAIKGPVAEKTFDPETGSTNRWAGSYVWYGKYDGTPVKYRVLSPKTTKYGATTMFLDCENVLYEVKYDEDKEPNSGQTYPNEWDGSDLKISLNGLDFFWKNNGFTDLERYAIKGSTIAGHPRIQDNEADGCVYSPLSDFDDFTPLTGEKIFVLDIGEMIPQYGYFFPSKTGLDGDAFMWWTRSAHKPIVPSYGSCVGYATGYVYSTGPVNASGLSWRIGASPAFNVDLNSVIFSSVVSGTAGKDNAEYKLTLKDNKIILTAKQHVSGDLTKALIITDKTEISLRLQLSGANADNVTQVSVLVLDKEYKPGNTNNAKILHYAKADISGGLSELKTIDTVRFELPVSFNLDDWGSKYYVYALAEDVNDSHESDYACEPVLLAKPTKFTSVINASVKYPSITKGTAQEFEVTTTSDVRYLIMSSDRGENVEKTWEASGNSKIDSYGRRIWNVSYEINTTGDRKMIFYGGTTDTKPASNSYAVLFKVEDTGVISASAKNAVIPKGGEQVFTVKTTSDAKYLVEYAEDGNKVKTWTADSSNSTVSGNVRTWTVKQNIATAGKRTLAFRAGTTSTPTSVQKTASFTVETVWVISASAKNATIGKGGTQTFTVKTTYSAAYLMLYAEGGNLVKTWTAAGNSTRSGDTRTWTVDLAIGSVGNRELTLKACKSMTPKAGQSLTPSALGKTVKFAVVEKKIVSASAKYAAITKSSVQGFTVKTSSDVKYLMLYAEDGKTLVKSWAASGNSTLGADNIRTWYVMQAINTAGNRKLVFKGGASNTTPITNAATVSFKVENTGVLTVSAKNATITKGSTQTFTVTTTADCKYLAEYAESGNFVTSWTANSSNSKVSGNVRTWTVTQKINTAGKRTLTFKAGVSSPTAAERNVSFTVQ